MKTSIFTIRLDKNLEKLLNQACNYSSKTMSEIAREALQRQLKLLHFEELRKKIMPFAEARGYLTGEDVFSDIS